MTELRLGTQGPAVPWGLKEQVMALTHGVWGVAGQATTVHHTTMPRVGGGTLDQESALAQHQDGSSRRQGCLYDGFFTKMLKGALHASAGFPREQHLVTG